MIPHLDFVVQGREMELVVALGDGPLTPEQIAAKLQMPLDETQALLASAYPRHVVNRESKEGVTTYTPGVVYHRLDPLSMYENWGDVPTDARDAVIQWQLDEFINAWLPVVEELRLDPDKYTRIPNRDVLLLDEGARNTVERGHGRRLTKDEMKAIIVNAQRSFMARVIPILKEITEANSLLAASLRADFRQRDVLVLDIVASPGAGKTSLLERTIERLKDELRIAVIEGDPTSTLDADRVEAAGVPAVQINTGGGCHLEAGMIRAALGPDGLNLDGADIIIIENVGNLLCPTGWDLGEDAKVVVASLPEGDDKPLKYPMAFLAGQAVVINKIDLEPYIPAKAARLRANALAVNPDLAVFEVSCLTGAGLDAWLDWIKTRLAAKRTNSR